MADKERRPAGGEWPGVWGAVLDAAREGGMNAAAAYLAADLGDEFGVKSDVFKR